jgi:UDP-N-acetylmuramate dehydrogenase
VDSSLLRSRFADRLQENVSLGSHTSSRVGGAAAFFVHETEIDQFEADVKWCWQHAIPFKVLGGGTNILVGSNGLDKLVLQNRCNHIEITGTEESPIIYAESGATFAAVSRFAAQHSLSGLEWACAIPGTLGGAVYGNAGAFGSDMSRTMQMAYIVDRDTGSTTISTEDMAYSYRSSLLKREPGKAVILAANLIVRPGDAAEITTIMEANTAKRRASQPGGASTGSTFKNPVGDHAGRLIEAAGLKGTRVGGVQVSPIHANFFINDGTGTPEDYLKLIRLVQATVAKKFGVNLDLEIELLGSWQGIE